MTEDTLEGKVTEPTFRQAVVWLVGGRLAGTLLAQLLLLPCATLIAAIAEKV